MTFTIVHEPTACRRLRACVGVVRMRALVLSMLGFLCIFPGSAVEVNRILSRDVRKLIAIYPQAIETRDFRTGKPLKFHQGDRLVQPLTQEERFNAAKQRILDDTITVTRNNLQQIEVRRALAWRGKDPIAALLRALEIPILPAHLERTSYDVSELQKRYPVQIGIKPPDGKYFRIFSEPKFVSAMMPTPHGKYYHDDDLIRANGFFVDGKTLVACEHTIKNFKMVRVFSETIHSTSASSTLVSDSYHSRK